MTVEGCIKFLQAYKEGMLNEGFTQSQREQSRLNYENMKAHILKSRKFRDHPILKELEQPKEKPKEDKKDVKKSKR